MALTLFDPATLERRDATQLDVDELCEVRAEYGRFLALFQQSRANLIEKVKALRSQHGMPNDLMVDPPRAKEPAADA